MRVLVYKRTHTGDPGASRQFGVNKCMGRVRGFPFDIAIGIGGTSSWPKKEGIAGKLTWLGRKPQISENPSDPRGPLVSFAADDFRLYDQQGPFVQAIAPLLFKRMYGRRIRFAFASFGTAELAEIEQLVANLLDHGKLDHLRLDSQSTDAPCQAIRRCKKSRPTNTLTTECRITNCSTVRQPASRLAAC